MKFGTKLAFIFILIGATPLVVGGFFLLYFFNGYFQEKTHSHLEDVSKITLLQAENFLFQVKENAEFFTKNYITFDEEDSLQKKEEDFQKIKDSYRFFNEIAFLDEEGRLILSSGDDFHEEILKKELESPKENGVYFSDIVVFEDEAFLFLFVPTKKESFPFLVFSLDIQTFFDRIDTDADERSVFLLNSEGSAVFHSGEDDAFKEVEKKFSVQENKGKEKGAFSFFLQDEEMIASFHNIENGEENLEWRLVVAVPKNEAFRFLKEMVLNYFFLSVILLFPIIVFAFFLSRKMIQPLKKISMTAKKVAQGDLDVRAKISSKDEFGELAENFNKMVKDLNNIKEKQAEEKDVLEVKVRARTRELNELNKNLEKEIEKRTEEMQRKLREFEKMSKLMVGREMKMIELKKNLEEAEKEIERLKEEKEDD